MASHNILPAIPKRRTSQNIMILSVIIVNYRVRYFLELCLRSVQKAAQGIELEIIVVDNDPDDGGLDFLRPLFPAVSFIANTENTGFARANNQALKQARGNYILFLNPDTILPEGFVKEVLKFYESMARSRVGAVGVRMIDGSGRFLKESRRGFPSAWVAFCKLSGLTAVFPKSRLFSTYYLGHLSPAATHPAPILSGACFWVAREILEKTGGFDERFFMYAEDIDLSYRIEKAGYVNYYLATTTIIHFKGESTRKGPMYVKLFYKAMSQFRRKHFKHGLSSVFNTGMDAAIWLRAGVRAVALAVRGNGGEDAEGEPAPLTTCLTGDPATIEILKNSATFFRNRILVETPDKAKELILCQGEQFSFTECIAALEAAQPWRSGLRVKFYAKGAGSVIGSAHRDGRGEVLVL
ncbi:MAG: glycosyltransferase family 2 protein [Bacteroidetes bacterium]|nr:glycosyltransferase family 2 protein [Bacteroidota bacterium]